MDRQRLRRLAGILQPFEVGDCTECKQPTSGRDKRGNSCDTSSVHYRCDRLSGRPPDSTALEQGHRVNGTVRSLSKSPKLAALYELADRFPGQLELFQADLLTAGSFRSAIRGCSHVFHTASPSIERGPPSARFGEPAVKGVEHVLNDVAEVTGVERVILTSSVAAMYGDVIEYEDDPIDEYRWNTTSSLAHQPYQYSKTLAERRVGIEKEADYQLVVVNPSLVLGPAIG